MGHKSYLRVCRSLLCLLLTICQIQYSFSAKRESHSLVSSPSPLASILEDSSNENVELSFTPRPIHVEKNSNLSLDDSIYSTVEKPIFRPIFTTINNGERHVYPYKFSREVLSRWPAFQLQFYAESEEPKGNLSSETNYPLHVTVHWHGSIKSWDVPVNYINSSVAESRKDRYANHSIGKTLWLYPQLDNKYLKLTIEVSVVSELMISYKIRIVSLKNFVVSPSLPITGSATHFSPSFFKFYSNPANHWELAFIHVVSDSEICTLMSVHKPRGPFLELEDTPKERQYTLTFTMKSGLTIKMAEFPDGFIISFIPFVDDGRCHRPPISRGLESNPYRPKPFSFQIRQVESPLKYTYYYPLAIPLLVFAFIAILVVWFQSYFHRLRIRKCNEGKRESQQLQFERRHSTEMQSNIMIQDLIITCPSRVVGQTNRYCTAGIVTSAFYSVPVFQLIMTFSRRFIESGNLDICFFNHFCSHLVGPFHDFNHMFSNIWYSLFGCLFMALVWIRQVTFDPNYDGTQNPSQNSLFWRMFPKGNGRLEFGVMKHYGLLYTMGYAMFMTGVMSTGYHICPNQSNFQFDTVFMYTIGAITVVTIYQARHPTYLSANFTFTALAMVICITVLGLLWEQSFIRIIFSVVHMLFLVFSLPKVCYNGYVRKNGKLVAHWVEMMEILLSKFKDDWAHSRLFRIQRTVWVSPENKNIIIIPGPGRLVLPVFLFTINVIGIATTWTILSRQNFATQVLFICVVNGACYTVFYSVLKRWHSECDNVVFLQPFTYLVLSFALWTGAMIFFLDELATWESSPAHSRLKNRDCLLFQFYDSHDMWHFLSAAALFSSAMVLLTVDDDILGRHKRNIPVF